MAEWGLCCTLNAPADQVLAFVAHHLSLGASRLWLFFDDPDDPACDAVAGIAGVTPTRCDTAFWRPGAKPRPDAHQDRQSQNMQRVYAAAELPWVGHIDVDEFLLPGRPIAALLDEVSPGKASVRLAPWEALCEPSLPDDIFTARRFRAALKGPAFTAIRHQVFGHYADLLGNGVLSHSAGKCFFQRGFPGLQPRLHGALLNGIRVKDSLFHAEIALLHFHAESRDRWKRRLQFRLTRGAYQYNPKLQAYLLTASDDEIDAFYAAVQQPAAAVLRFLDGQDLLIETDLGLRAKVAGLQSATVR